MPAEATHRSDTFRRAQLYTVPVHDVWLKHEASLRAFRAEFELQLSLRHANLVQVVGGCWNLEDVNVCILFEVCEKGTLQKARPRPRTPPLPQKGGWPSPERTRDL